jgi:hypothetical protein
MVINLPSGEQKFAKAGQFDRLYRNDLNANGRPRFTDVTKRAGLTGNYHGLDGCWWDADHDGDADLYVTNDFTDPDQFYQNNGDGTFTDVTLEALPCTPWFAMGCDVDWICWPLIWRERRTIVKKWRWEAWMQSLGFSTLQNPGSTCGTRCTSIRVRIDFKKPHTLPAWQVLIGHGR